jgi:hypothetical protein
VLRHENNYLLQRADDSRFAHGARGLRFFRECLRHNVGVPFTLAHGAAALPFRRFHLVFSALLVGTFAPDFEYLLRLSPDDGFGHTLLGTFALTLPLALLVLWLFHNFVKRPVVGLLPDVIQRRLTNHLGEFTFRGPVRFALIVSSILLGIMTHLVWDSFTHANTWPYRHWPILSQQFHVPLVGTIPLYEVLQHGSTLIGIGILSIWLAFCYRVTEPSSHPPSNRVWPVRRMLMGCCFFMVALVGGIVRATTAIGIPDGHPAEKRFVGLVVVTAVALVWWQLVIYGFFTSKNR